MFFPFSFVHGVGVASSGSACKVSLSSSGWEVSLCQLLSLVSLVYCSFEFFLVNCCECVMVALTVSIVLR